MNKMNRTFTAVIWLEERWFVATCPEAGVTSQGKTLESALANLREAVSLHLEDADTREELPTAPSFVTFFTLKTLDPVKAFEELAAWGRKHAKARGFDVSPEKIVEVQHKRRKLSKR